MTIKMFAEVCKTLSDVLYQGMGVWIMFYAIIIIFLALKLSERQTIPLFAGSDT